MDRGRLRIVSPNHAALAVVLFVLAVGCSGATVPSPAFRETLRKQLAEVARELGDNMFSGWDGTVPETVSVELAVTATGEVGIVVAKASVSVGTSITLTFARPH